MQYFKAVRLYIEAHLFACALCSHDIIHWTGNVFVCIASLKIAGCFQMMQNCLITQINNFAFL